jgi:hypothetical protein
MQEPFSTRSCFQEQDLSYPQNNRTDLCRGWKPIPPTISILMM